MDIPKTNYLKNSAPELENEFIEILGKVPLFEQLPHNLLQLLFQYSRFIKLRHEERPIQQGMFDQSIFVLISGKLEVLVKDENGKEVLVDIMEQPFTLFGERSLLGEPRGASLQAADNVLVLCMDMAFLPDILDGMDNPENKQEDEAYQQNMDMYTTFAIVLSQRLQHLVEEQLKLKQRIQHFRENKNLQEHDKLRARILTQICSEGLPIDEDIRTIIYKELKKYGVTNPVIGELLRAQTLSSQFYFELVRLKFLGRIQSLDELLFRITHKITELVFEREEYKDWATFNMGDMPDLTTLVEYLDSLYNMIVDSKVLVNKLSKIQFLNAIINEGALDPYQFSRRLTTLGLTKDRLDHAYIMYLICQSAIYTVSESNRNISRFLKLLSTISEPYHTRMDVSNTNTEALIQSLTHMQEQQDAVLNQPTTPSLAAMTQPEQEEQEGQEDVDDLLKSLGL